MTDLSQLQQELATFEKNRNDLLATSKGKFILIKGDRILNTFTNYQDALAEGYKLFGNVPFLVKEITEIEQTNYFTRPVFR